MVCDENGLQVGESTGGLVGYQIRLEARRSECTQLLFCTTVVLLRLLVQGSHLLTIAGFLLLLV